jgi:hypothetical protein
MKKIYILLLIIAIDYFQPAYAAPKAIKPAPINYSDITGPEMISVTADKNELDLSKKSALIKITMTVSDDLNSIDGAMTYFSRLDGEGKITGSKLFAAKNSIRVSSTKIEGRIVEIFEMSTTFPKGLAKGKYQLLTGDFRDLASNRRSDLSDVNKSLGNLPVITVK